MADAHSVTDELANWVLRINKLCSDKDAEIERLRGEIESWKALVRDYERRSLEQQLRPAAGPETKNP